MTGQASSQYHFSTWGDGCTPGREHETASHEPASRPETSQAERAAMHPERHDVEWDYYFMALSH